MFAEFGPLSLNLSRDRTQPGGQDLWNRVTCLYEIHRDGVYRFLVAQGLSTESAQDVTQDVFVKLFVALREGKKIASEQGWLYSVAARSAVDLWRRERASMWAPLEFEDQPGSPISTDPSPELATMHTQRVRRVARALMELRKEQRMCVLLRSQGLRYREIANNLGVSVSTVCDWLASAIERLRGAADD